MGRSLHSVIEEENKLLSEEDVLQLTCRIVSGLLFPSWFYQLAWAVLVKCDFFFCVCVCFQLDVLQFMHSNEYVHADVNAENVYIKQKSQVRNLFERRATTKRTE